MTMSRESATDSPFPVAMCETAPHERGTDGPAIRNADRDPPRLVDRDDRVRRAVHPGRADRLIPRRADAGDRANRRPTRRRWPTAPPLEPQLERLALRALARRTALHHHEPALTLLGLFVV